MPYICCCCIVFQCNAPYPFYTKIASSLPSAAREMFVTSLVHSRLDYCNVIFAGLPVCDIRRLQSLLNSSVRLVAGARKYDHVTPLFATGCRLPNELSINYAHSFVSDYRVMHNGTLLITYVALTSSVCRRRSLRSADCILSIEVPRADRLSFGDRAFSVAGSPPGTVFP